MSVDPLYHKRYGLSPYNYVQNNPLIRIDPTGEIDKKALFFASIRTSMGIGSLVVGYAAISGASFSTLLSGGTTSPVTVPIVIGGLSATTYGFYESSAGLHDLVTAYKTPDGMTADQLKSISAHVVKAIGGNEDIESISSILEMIATGKVGKKVVDDKVVQAVLEAMLQTETLVKEALNYTERIEDEKE